VSWVGSIYSRVLALGYDAFLAWGEDAGMQTLRRNALAEATGWVLEIGVGSGLNLPYYHGVDELHAVDPSEPLLPFELWGPTCDSIDYMKGPFMLPGSVAEGDYLEIGNMGAYARAIAGRFNGYGEYDEVILLDPPMLSMYEAESAATSAARR